MKKFYQNLKLNPVINRIRNYINKWIQHVPRMDRDRLSQLLNIDHVGNEAKDGSSKEFSAVNGTGTGQKA
jgi:hypothetical protein